MGLRAGAHGLQARAPIRVLDPGLPAAPRMDRRSAGPALRAHDRRPPRRHARGRVRLARPRLPARARNGMGARHRLARLRACGAPRRPPPGLAARLGRARGAGPAARRSRARRRPPLRPRDAHGLEGAAPQEQPGALRAGARIPRRAHRSRRLPPDGVRRGPESTPARAAEKPSTSDPLLGLEEEAAAQFPTSRGAADDPDAAGQSVSPPCRRLARRDRRRPRRRRRPAPRAAGRRRRQARGPVSPRSGSARSRARREPRPGEVVLGLPRRDRRARGRRRVPRARFVVAGALLPAGRMFFEVFLLFVLVAARRARPRAACAGSADRRRRARADAPLPVVGEHQGASTAGRCSRSAFRSSVDPVRVPRPDQVGPLGSFTPRELGFLRPGSRSPCR